MIPLMKNAFLNEQETKEELAKFEEEFAAFQGAKEAVLFNSDGSKYETFRVR